MKVAGYDEVHRVECGSTMAFVSIHALIRGRAFGGIRIRPYPSEDAALKDALDLSRAMSRKAVMAGLEAGGAKSVLIEPKEGRAEAVRALGAFIESLGGRYHCGADLGFTPADHEELRKTTRHVACGVEGAHTSASVLMAMKAVVDPSRVAIQGLGSVGRPLADLLAKEGKKVVAADVRPVGGFESVAPDRIFDVDADVFAPCAAGGVLDAAAVARLKVKVVCGAANNPFASDADAERLHARGILYVPDFIANAGALIVGASTAMGEVDRIDQRFDAIPGRVREVVERSKAAGRSPHFIANEMADAAIDMLRGSRAGQR